LHSTVRMFTMFELSSSDSREVVCNGGFCPQMESS
jgi:hypothetical protein